jgi:hypothetical protein
LDGAIIVASTEAVRETETRKPSSGKVRVGIDVVGQHGDAIATHIRPMPVSRRV